MSDHDFKEMISTLDDATARLAALTADMERERIAAFRSAVWDMLVDHTPSGIADIVQAAIMDWQESRRLEATQGRHDDRR